MMFMLLYVQICIFNFCKDFQISLYIHKLDTQNPAFINFTCDKGNDYTQLTYNCNYFVQNKNTNKNDIVAALKFSD